MLSNFQHNGLDWTYLVQAVKVIFCNLIIKVFRQFSLAECKILIDMITLPYPPPFLFKSNFMVFNVRSLFFTIICYFSGGNHPAKPQPAAIGEPEH